MCPILDWPYLLPVSCLPSSSSSHLGTYTLYYAFCVYYNAHRLLIATVPGNSDCACIDYSYLCSKKLFTAVHNFVHLNLAIALFAGYLTFAVGVELAKDNEVHCVHVLVSVKVHD